MFQVLVPKRDPVRTVEVGFEVFILKDRGWTAEVWFWVLIFSMRDLVWAVEVGFEVIAEEEVMFGDNFLHSSKEEVVFCDDFLHLIPSGCSWYWQMSSSQSFLPPPPVLDFLRTSRKNSIGASGELQSSAGFLVSNQPPFDETTQKST